MIKFNLAAQNRVTTPLSSGVNPTPHEEQATTSQIHAFQQRVGSIIYPSIITRPDIAYAAANLSQFNKNPSSQHIHEAERVILYLYNTRYRGIQYPGISGPSELIANDERFAAASDASFADNIADRKSTQGYIISLFGGAIAWQSTKQRTITTSTTEAELLSLSTVGREVIAMRRFFKQLRLMLDSEPIIHCDNLQTVGIINNENPPIRSKLRHVDIHQLWLRQEAGSGRLMVMWTPTTNMTADSFTKPLSPQKHNNFIKLLNMGEN